MNLRPLAVGVGITLGNRRARRRAPVIATNGDGFLVVWAEGTDNPTRVLATLVDAHGVAATPAGQLLFESTFARAFSNRQRGDAG